MTTGKGRGASGGGGGGSGAAAHLDEQLAGAQDEAGVSVAHPGGELSKGARVAGVAVRSEQHLACAQGRTSREKFDVSHSETLYNLTLDETDPRPSHISR